VPEHFEYQVCDRCGAVWMSTVDALSLAEFFERHDREVGTVSASGPTRSGLRIVSFSRRTAAEVDSPRAGSRTLSDMDADNVCEAV